MSRSFVLNFHKNRGVYYETHPNFELCFWIISFYIIKDNHILLNHFNNINNNYKISMSINNLSNNINKGKTK